MVCLQLLFGCNVFKLINVYVLWSTIIFLFLGNLDDLVMEDNLNFSVDRENESPILNNPLSSSLQASGKLNLLYALYKLNALN